MVSRLTIAVVVLLAVAMYAGLTTASLAEKADKDQKLTIDQLPAAVRTTLEKLAGSNTIEDLEKETEDGVTFYSADIIKGDQKVGVEIGEDGKLLNTEVEARDQGKGEDDDKDDEDDDSDADDD